MLKNIFFISLGLAFFIPSCKKATPEKLAPTCIEERILEFEKTSCDRGAKVYEYDFQGQRVYVFDPGFCGSSTSAKVVSQDCEEIGVIGGVNGNQNINGGDFAQAQKVRVLWSK